MAARLLLRTHYQADEPALLSLLVRDVVSGSRSMYKESAADHLSKSASKLGLKLNVAAAAYAVDLARELGLVTDRYSLAARGRVLALVAEGQKGVFETKLSEAERFAILAFFLSADALALGLLAKRLEAAPAARTKLISDGVIEEIFREVTTFYLNRATDIRERTTLRGELGRLANDYKGRTPQHKLDVRLTVLCRVGILAEVEGNYAPAEGGACQRLVSLVSDPENLELDLRKGCEVELAGRTLLSGVVRGLPTPTLDELQEVYGEMVGTATEFVEVDALADLLAIRGLARNQGFVSRAAIREKLQQLSKQHPKAVRFHVDRTGRPAFLALTPGALV